MKIIKILEISYFWDIFNFGQLRCLLELGGFPYLSEFEQTSEMRNSQGTRGTREPPGFLQAAPLRCFFFLPPFYIAGPPPFVGGTWGLPSQGKGLLSHCVLKRPHSSQHRKAVVQCLSTAETLQ